MVWFEKLHHTFIKNIVSRLINIMKTRKGFKILLGFLLWGFGLFLFFVNSSCAVIFSMYEPWLEEIGKLIVKFSSFYGFFILTGLVLIFLGRHNYIKKTYNIIFLIISAFVVFISLSLFFGLAGFFRGGESVFFNSPIVALNATRIQAELYYEDHNESYIGFTNDPYVIEHFINPLRVWWEQNKNNNRYNQPVKKICRDNSYSFRYYEPEDSNIIAGEYWKFTPQGTEHDIICIDDTGVYSEKRYFSELNKITQFPTGKKCVE